MKTLSLLLSVGMVTLLMGSCSQSQPGGQQPATQPSPAASPTPAPPSPQAFQGSTQAGTSPSSPAVAGLIPSTNPAQRRQEVRSGRADPFALIPLQLAIKPPAVEAKVNPTSKPRTGAKQEPATTPNAPSLPSVPELAKAVVVTGAIEVGGIPQLIVQSPNEPFSRYVQPGQYIANGQVLIKRVDMSQDPPVVVLEELGQEIYKTVGEGTEEKPTEPSQAAAALIANQGSL